MNINIEMLKREHTYIQNNVLQGGLSNIVY